MINQTYITITGKNKLEEELAELKGPQRLELARRLKSAIEMGDLSENADYKAAKEDQGFLEGRILEIEAVLSNAKVIDESETTTNEVQIGNKVTIKEDNEPEEVFKLVGARESNARIGKISYESPLGAALIGKKKGDLVTVQTPGGELKVKIIKIE
ncbi:MAG: transcription elongation factor GreA [Anaerolineaceae bacterium]